ncbi:hypothetical protein [Pedobacter rhizosphaerae]|uniref:Uncharacterized protein n=1 Tax=Pedobacter rhizosphaerae TaxID=390241 RepID=A0A1H9M3G4_9SPHI|nr:hypothetical protein [Pedobacter rhizosphaerae]SER18184.1 hypothetical protein SAMN04488023_10583 [Pedobacter rhizosphaerae]
MKQHLQHFEYLPNKLYRICELLNSGIVKISSWFLPDRAITLREKTKKNIQFLPKTLLTFKKAT